jgi:hypothetical protein
MMVVHLGRLAPYLEELLRTSSLKEGVVSQEPTTAAWLAACLVPPPPNISMLCTPASPSFGTASPESVISTKLQNQVESLRKNYFHLCYTGTVVSYKSKELCWEPSGETEGTQ